MKRCTHTGLTLPECSCRACLVALVERYAPELRGKYGTSAPTPLVSPRS
jgi:hypothetical protein